MTNGSIWIDCDEVFSPVTGLYNRPIPLVYIAATKTPMRLSGTKNSSSTPQLQIQRNLDNELRAHAFLALNLDRAAVVLYDSVRDRQPKARTLADRLGGKERVEDLAPDCVGDTRSVVANRDQENLARLAGCD